MFRPWREFGAVDRTGGKIAVARSSGPAPEPLGRNARFANGVSVAGRLRGHPMQDTAMRPIVAASSGPFDGHATVHHAGRSAKRRTCAATARGMRVR